MKRNTALKDVNDGKVTSEQSSHPVGTTLGTVGGMAAGAAGAVVAGAAAGSAVGPVGAAVGAVIGGGLGAGVGHEIAAQLNPKEEDLFWRENYARRPYVKAGVDYDSYRPAYLYGVDAYVMYRDKDFDDIESNLGRNWDSVRGTSKLEWDDAKYASRDAFNRLNNSK